MQNAARRLIPQDDWFHFVVPLISVMAHPSLPYIIPIAWGGRKAKNRQFCSFTGFLQEAVKSN